MIADGIEDVFDDFGIPVIVPQYSLLNIIRHWKIDTGLSNCAEDAFVSWFFLRCMDLHESIGGVGPAFSTWSKKS